MKLADFQLILIALHVCLDGLGWMDMEMEMEME